jgi:hypothetical protein
MSETTIKTDKQNELDTMQIAQENFEGVKKELKPRMKKLSKSSLIDIALRLSLQVTYLKEELKASKEVNKESKATKEL